MNDNLLYENELKNRSLYIRRQRNGGVPILVIIGFYILVIVLSEDFTDSPLLHLLGILYFSFLIVVASLSTVYASNLMGKIKVRSWGLGIEPLYWGTQSVRWAQIKKIQREDPIMYRGAVKLGFDIRVWKVTTDIKPRFRLSKEQTVSFYITNWHEYYEELFELIHEQSGVELPSSKPPRKW
ncbi:MAG: hypothetical protein V2J07_04670 [Anaerolineae bacterium]|jgi:hypothetical protein|nr:hypothetical protein [Anaerolineae bacterium]